jgi:hypothetical protein
MLDLNTYKDHLGRIEIQYRLIRYALARLPDSRLREFFRALKKEKITRTEENVAQYKQEMPDLLDILPRISEFARRHFAKEFSRKNQRFYREFVEDGVNASELLVRVAHFEAFMKSIHGRILSCQPTLLATVHADRKVSYSDIFKEGVSYATIVNQEICREVEEVDRKGVKGRADYFSAVLKIRWCGTVELEFLDEEVMETRNKLSHEDPSLPVSADLLTKASDLMDKIPTKCWNEAKKRYRNF